MTEFEERQLDEAIEVRLFLRDNRHLRFEETPENFNALGRFVDEHGLPVTAAKLHCAYEDLVARGELELMPLAKPEQPAPIPQPTTRACAASRAGGRTAPCCRTSAR